ncbi:hypothetical protein JTE90_023463 [Oedothorax gibbosus]|uniref:Uncharacterized protein n=1 Tax=Oedothorax gibbosus TaxID=931172 RepID=A0AAV6TLC4_9ARAC|nr:hypothetical protein JTE90_023463 [Oedothorax gibbosus]
MSEGPLPDQARLSSQHGHLSHEANPVDPPLLPPSGSPHLAPPLTRPPTFIVTTMPAVPRLSATPPRTPTSSQVTFQPQASSHPRARPR